MFDKFSFSDPSRFNFFFPQNSNKQKQKCLKSFQSENLNGEKNLQNIKKI